MVCFLKQLDIFFFTGSPLDKEMEHQSLYVLAYAPDVPSKLIDNENFFSTIFYSYACMQCKLGVEFAMFEAMLCTLQFLVW